MPLSAPGGALGQSVAGRMFHVKHLCGSGVASMLCVSSSVDAVASAGASRQIYGRHVACLPVVWLLYVPAGGGPPARRPCRELRSARRLEARPGPAATLRHRSHAARPEDHAQASDRAVHGAYLSAAVTPYGRYTSL